MKHGNNFDFLRFLFSFLVVIGHTIILSENTLFGNDFFAAMPNYSVFCFFIISGYLVFSSFERLQNIRKYLINRLKRILPAYIFVVIFFSVFLFIFSDQSISNYFSSEWLQYIGANLIFLNFLKPCIDFVFSNNLTCAINGSLWTIKVEMMFYLFVPFLFYLMKKMTLHQKNITLVLLYFLSTLYFDLMLRNNNELLAKQLPGCLNYFVSGIFLYLNADYFKKYKNIFILPAVGIVLLEKGLLLQNILTPFALGIAIFWFAFLKLPLKNFGKYGDFSYGMYLVHFPIIQIFVQKGWYEKYGFSAFGMSTFIVIISSVFIWKIIEEPVLRKKFSRKPL